MIPPAGPDYQMFQFVSVVFGLSGFPHLMLTEIDCVCLPLCVILCRRISRSPPRLDWLLDSGPFFVNNTPALSFSRCRFLSGPAVPVGPPIERIVPCQDTVKTVAVTVTAAALHAGDYEVGEEHH